MTKKESGNDPEVGGGKEILEIDLRYMIIESDG